LFIVAKDNKNIFYHGRRNAQSMVPLQEEFRRLSTNPLITLTDVLKDFISRPGLSITTLNCQSLLAHSADLNDTVIQRCNILILSETWIENNNHINILNFNCAVQFKRQNVRAGGVAILHSTAHGTNIVAPNMDLNLQQMESLSVGLSSVGEICAAECRTDSGQQIMIIALYISPNQSIAKIIKFIQLYLLPYTAVGAAELGVKLDEIPIILGGDFNINFASDDAKPLIQFLEEKLSLRMNNSPTESTTRHGTTIDAVFSRFLENLESRVFITYFSYHKPIISFLKNEEDDAQ
jgi:hypothetical protein